MSIEVEAKAHILDPQAVSNALKTEGFTYHGAIYKDDRYYRGTNGFEFRLRFESSAPRGRSGPLRQAGDVHAVVTHKEKQIYDGMEYNAESEFSVDDPEAFESLCRNLGSERFAVKRKHAQIFRRRGVLAEVVEVEGLGWFLEVECLVSEASDRQKAADEIRYIISASGIGPDAVERRTYLSMLGFRDSQPREMDAGEI